jgi:hypothetical protein
MSNPAQFSRVRDLACRGKTAWTAAAEKLHARSFARGGLRMTQGEAVSLQIELLPD